MFMDTALHLSKLMVKHLLILRRQNQIPWEFHSWIFFKYSNFLIDIQHCFLIDYTNALASSMKQTINKRGINNT